MLKMSLFTFTLLSVLLVSVGTFINLASKCEFLHESWNSSDMHVICKCLKVNRYCEISVGKFSICFWV